MEKNNKLIKDLSTNDIRNYFIASIAENDKFRREISDYLDVKNHGPGFFTPMSLEDEIKRLDEDQLKTLFTEFGSKHEDDFKQLKSGSDQGS